MADALHDPLDLDLDDVYTCGGHIIHPTSATPEEKKYMGFESAHRCKYVPYAKLNRLTDTVRGKVVLVLSGACLEPGKFISTDWEYICSLFAAQIAPLCKRGDADAKKNKFDLVATGSMRGHPDTVSFDEIVSRKLDEQGVTCCHFKDTNTVFKFGDGYTVRNGTTYIVENPHEGDYENSIKEDILSSCLDGTQASMFVVAGGGPTVSGNVKKWLSNNKRGVSLLYANSYDYKEDKFNVSGATHKYDKDKKTFTDIINHDNLHISYYMFDYNVFKWDGNTVRNIYNVTDRDAYINPDKYPAEPTTIGWIVNQLNRTPASPRKPEPPVALSDKRLGNRTSSIATI